MVDVVVVGSQKYRYFWGAINTIYTYFQLEQLVRQWNISSLLSDGKKNEKKNLYI